MEDMLEGKNARLEAALEEADEMMRNPEQGKSYGSFAELREDV